MKLLKRKGSLNENMWKELQLKGLKSGQSLVVSLTFRFVQHWAIGNMIGCIKDFKSNPCVGWAKDWHKSTNTIFYFVLNLWKISFKNSMWYPYSPTNKTYYFIVVNFQKIKETWLTISPYFLLHLGRVETFLSWNRWRWSCNSCVISWPQFENINPIGIFHVRLRQMGMNVLWPQFKHIYPIKNISR